MTTVMTAPPLRQVGTLAWRSLVSLKHNPFELFDLSVQPIMFVFLFTYVFGGAISGSPAEYLQFALPGIIVQTAIFAALNTGVGLNNDLEKGVYDRLLSMPIARWSPLAGRIVADTVKQVWGTTVLFGLGYLLGYRAAAGASGVVASYLLILIFALAISWLGVLVGVLATSPEKVQIFGFVVAFPLTFTSNVFVPTNTMPGWLQAWVKINPISVLADAIRAMLDGLPAAGAVGQSVVWAILITVVLAPVSVWRFRKRT